MKTNKKKKRGQQWKNTETGATKVCPIDEEEGPNGIEETELVPPHLPLEFPRNQYEFVGDVCHSKILIKG